MKIALITSKKSVIDPTELIESELKSRVIGVDVVRKVAINNLEIFREVKSYYGFDVICVLLYYEESSPDIEVLIQKLIDLQIKNANVISFVEKFSGDDAKEIGMLVVDELIKKFIKVN
jgi:hypothetical protein